MPKKTKKPAPAPKKKTPAKKIAKASPKKSPSKHVKPSSKKPAPKPAAKAKHAAKPAPAKKSVPSPKKHAAKPVAPAKHAARHDAKSAHKSAPSAKSSPAKHTAPAKVDASAKSAPASSAKSSARADLRSKILEKSRGKAPARPTTFSFDEIRQIAAQSAVKHDSETKTVSTAAAKSGKTIDSAKIAKAAQQPHHIKAASLADILGFNPKKARQPAINDESEIPEKFRRYFKLLIDLRNHLTGQIDTHAEETLKRSSKDDAGDLSSYGQHMADAGTDTFDRDFALSLVSSEQEALSEVEAAIGRIKDGTYGICEITQKPIARERLLAVPFTRYSAEAQKDIERNRHRSRTQAGLFGELGEDVGGMGGGDDGGGDE